MGSGDPLSHALQEELGKHPEKIPQGYKLSADGRRLLQAGEETAYEVCPECRAPKPLHEFHVAESGGPIICNDCRESDRPRQLEETLKRIEGELTVPMRAALHAYMNGANKVQAARAGGFTEGYMRMLLRGTKTPEFRQAFQLMLTLEGLDLPSIIRGLRSAEVAVQAKWNPATETWNYFPDNQCRLNATRTLAKLHEVEPRMYRNTESPISVNINCNLGEGAAVSDEATNPGHFEIDVTPRKRGSRPQAAK